MAFQKGNQMAKKAAKKKAAEPKENTTADIKEAEVTAKKDELKDADVLAAANQQQAEQAENATVLDRPLVKEYAAPAGVSVYHVWNLSTNPVLLRDSRNEILLLSREFRAIDSDTFEKLAKLQYVRDLLDKGLLRADKKASGNLPLLEGITEAKAPAELTENITRSDGVMTVTAEVKKDASGSPFRPAGTMDIRL